MHGHTEARAARKASYASYPFALGVASGEPLSDGVVIWTRLAPEPEAPDGFGGLPPDVSRPVSWQVATDESFGNIVRSGSINATPELGHSIHVEVSGLAPKRECFYRFRAGGDISPTGRTQTAPAVGSTPSRVRLAVTSCQDWLESEEQTPYAVYGDMTRRDHDLVVHVGDYAYRTAETNTLAGYRALYGRYKSVAELRQAHALFPFATVFDDHEVEQNWYGTSDDTEHLARRSAAVQAYYENLPLRAAQLPDGPGMQLFRWLDFGNLVRVHLLDTRQYRDQQVVWWPLCTERDPRVDDPDRTMLGGRQHLLLAHSLMTGEATWNVLAQQVIMAPVDWEPDPAENCVVHDWWEGYAYERQVVMDFIANERPANPVVLSGDWHSAWANDLNRDFGDPGSETLATEFACTSLSSGFCWNYDPDPVYRANPHVKYYNNCRRGYTRCTITPGLWTSDFHIVQNKYDLSKGAGIDATWVVREGEPGAVPG